MLVSIKHYLLLLLGVITMWLAPVLHLLILIIGAVIMDTLFGIWASIKTGQPIVSRKLQRIAIKCGLYSGSFLLCYGVDLIIIDQLLLSKFSIPLLMSKVVAICFVLVEVFSIDEKIRLANKDQGLFYYMGMIVDKLILVRRQATRLIENKDAVDPTDTPSPPPPNW